MLRINNEFVNSFINKNDYNYFRMLAEEIYFSKLNATSDMSGWIDYPNSINTDEIISYVNKVKKNDTVLVVIGIGGSYLGAASAIKMLKPQDSNKVYFIGPNMDNEYLFDILDICENHDCIVNVVSKSGSTFETSFYHDIFKNMLIHKYGDKYNEHICCTTSTHGILYDEAILNDYQLFFIPDNIGGRYSVLTPVGLLPMCFAGIDIENLSIGAKDSFKDLITFENDAYKYAIIRNVLYKNNFNIELFIGYRDTFEMFNEWLKQLFGESEGKNFKGIFPAGAIFPRDLHSLGQYLQDGKKQVFETCLQLKNIKNMDSIYIDNAYMEKINNAIVRGAAQAHSDGNTPVLIFEIDKLDAYHVGYMFYFFEKACAMSAYLLGVNPFDQPGVELYKKNIKRLLAE